MKSNSFGIPLLIIVTFPFLGLVNPIEAQLSRVKNNLLESGQLNFERVTASPGEDAPSGIQKGAGSNSGECQIGEQENPLVALVPEENATNVEDIYVWARTTQQFPTFWFYVAYPPNTYAQFELQDEQQNRLYKTTFQLKGTPGLVSFTLPSTQSVRLETGKRYFWYFYIMCGQPGSPDDFVSAWVEKVDLNTDITQKLQQATPIQQVNIYAENGIWHETLTKLAQLRSQQPENEQLGLIWANLLEQIDLEEFSQAAWVQHHEPEQ